MASRLMFDTNFIIRLGTKEYRNGEVPPRLASQIKMALDRGDSVLIPRTVQMELNARIKEQAEKELSEIQRAKDLLLNSGYTIHSPKAEEKTDIDAFGIIKQRFPDVYLLEPSPEDYFEAERRTSFREPPFPKNNPKAEEFRDRLMWCQIVGLSNDSDPPFVVASDDGIFENGALTKEGKEIRLIVLKTEEELSQWLDQRPSHIQRLIDELLLFKDEVATSGINLVEKEIDRIVDYRSVNESNGVMIKKFNLVFTDESSIFCRILYRGGVPVTVDLKLDGKDITHNRKLDPEEARASMLEQQLKASKAQFHEAELQQLIGN